MSVDNPSTCRIVVDVGLLNTTHENRAESHLYGELSALAGPLIGAVPLEMSCLPALKACIIPLAGSIMNLAASVTRRTKTASVCRPLKIVTATAHWSKSRALCVSTSLEPATAGTTSVPTGSSTARSPRAETTPLGRSLTGVP